MRSDMPEGRKPPPPMPETSDFWLNGTFNDTFNDTFTGKRRRTDASRRDSNSFDDGIQMSLAIFYTIVLSIILAYLLIKFRRNSRAADPDNDTIRASIKVLTFSCIALYLVLTVFTSIRRGAQFVDRDAYGDWSTEVKNMFSATQMLTFTLAKLVLYGNFFNQLYTTFSGTLYQLKRSTVVVILIAFFCELCLSIARVVVLVVLVDGPIYIEQNEPQQRVNAQMLMAMLVLELCFGTTIAGMFAYKLMQLAAAITRVHPRDEQSIKLDDHQKLLIEVITRNSMLTLLMLIFEALYVGTRLINIYENSEEESFLMIVMSKVMVYPSITCDVAALVLQLSFCHHLYWKTCSRCHRGCGIFCLKFAKRQIAKKVALSQNAKDVEMATSMSFS